VSPATTVRAGWLAIVLVGGHAVAQARGRGAVYLLSPLSRFEVATGKTGFFSFAGHDHVIQARAVTGHVVFDRADPAHSQVEIVVLAESLEVMTPPDTAEIRKVTAAMRTDVLDVSHYPEIRFVSRAVEPISGGLRVRGELVLVGATREVTVDVHLEAGADTLRATGTFSVNQSDFGIRPYRGGPGGLVRVADRVIFRFDALALRASAP
jgi:polyisoprenoid-binding protein YceI